MEEDEAVVVVEEEDAVTDGWMDQRGRGMNDGGEGGLGSRGER